MTERGSSYEEKYLTADEISAEFLAEIYVMFLTTLIVTVKMTVTLLLLEIGKTKLCILYRVTVTVNKVQTNVTMTMKH
jgi:hypothetical protein